MHFLKIHFLRCINPVGWVKKRHAPRCIHKMQAILSVFQKSLPAPLSSFDSIDWEWSWSHSLLKISIHAWRQLVPDILALQADHFWGAMQYSSGFTASLYLAFSSFARSFDPGTLNFEGFHISNILLQIISIPFDINVSKSVSLFVSAPLLTCSSPPGAASSTIQPLIELTF